MFGERTGEIFDRRDSTKYIALVLYLLHTPDYPYNIAKNFEKAKQDGKWNVKGAQSLAYPNTVAQLAKVLKKVGLIYEHTGRRKPGRPEKGRGLRKSRHHYIISPSLCRFEDEKGSMGKNEAICEITLGLLQQLSPSPDICIDKISEIPKLEYATLFAYTAQLLEEIVKYGELRRYTGQDTKLSTYEATEVRKWVLDNSKVSPVDLTAWQRGKKETLGSFQPVISRSFSIIERKRKEEELVQMKKMSFFQFDKFDGVYQKTILRYQKATGLPLPPIQEAKELAEHCNKAFDRIVKKERTVAGLKRVGKSN